MVERLVTAKATEGKELGVTLDNCEQAKWECDTALAKLGFLVKMLKPKDEDDESNLTLTLYERKGLAGVLEDVASHLHSVWSEVLAPVSTHVEGKAGVHHG